MKRLLLCALAVLALGYGQNGAERAIPAQELPKVLWRAPRPATIQDWACTFAGCDQAPAPPFQFLKNDSTGTTPKISIKDAKGRQFSVKFGSKVIPECFSSRFVAALGYTVEPSYYVGPGKVEGASDLRRVGGFVHRDGSFAGARFQLRDSHELEFLKDSAWSLVDNPFNGSHELAGLRILLILLSNWDMKDSRSGSGPNTAIFRSPGDGQPQLLYSFFDWGSTLGRWGNIMHRTRGDCSGFTQETPDLINGVRDGVVEWGFTSKHTNDVTHNITVEDLRWLAPYLQSITDDQLRTGLKASGATDRQTDCWAGALENRMQQVEAVARLGRLWR